MAGNPAMNGENWQGLPFTAHQRPFVPDRPRSGRAARIVRRMGSRSENASAVRSTVQTVYRPKRDITFQDSGHFPLPDTFGTPVSIAASDSSTSLGDALA